MPDRLVRTCSHTDSQFTVTTELEVYLLKMLNDVRWALKRKNIHERLPDVKKGDRACWLCLQNPFVPKRTKKELRKEDEFREQVGFPPLFRV